MIYEGDLNILTSMWEERLKNPSYDSNYKDALKECIYEVNSFVDSLRESDEEIQKYLDEQNADSYLSTMEAHEHFSN